MGEDQTPCSPEWPLHNDPNVRNDLAFHIDVSICTDKYDLPNLAILATHKFKAQLQHSWVTPSLVRAVSTIYNSHLAGEGIDERDVDAGTDKSGSSASSPLSWPLSNTDLTGT
jgi:hypothetical protein